MSDPSLRASHRCGPRLDYGVSGGVARLPSSASTRSAAVAGVGFTDYVWESRRSVLSLASEACRAAVWDCGLELSDVDGIVNYSFNSDSVTSPAIASTLALPRLTYSLDLNMAGQAPCLAIMHAAMAVSSGMANNVLVYRALNGRSGYRVGREVYSTPTTQYRYPVGVTAYAQFVAMWARRYMIETGATTRDLGAVVLAQRWYAEKNERAIRRRQISLEDYLAEPYLVEPLRSADCTIEVDGACAVLVTSLERARDLRHRPARVQGGAWVTGPRPGLDVGDVFDQDDLSANFTRLLADELWRSAGLGREDIEFAQIYDCFSSTVLFGLEGLGFVGRGEAGAFVASGVTAIDGSFPVNTNGGLLAEGYLQGMNTLVEAVLQIQSRGDQRQIPVADVGVVTSGALTDGSALVLTNGAR